MTCRRLRFAISGMMLVSALSRPALAQVNLTGIFSFTGIPDLCQSMTVTQDGVALTLFLDCAFMDLGATGIIDPVTGELTAGGGCIVGPLVGTSLLTGTAALDSSAFSGTITCPPALPGTWDYTAVRTCPDGTLDAGEECDDGNFVPDDGCSNLCVGAPVMCDDDDPCTRSVLDPMAGCLHLDMPQTGCRAAGKSQLRLKRLATDAAGLTWKWLKGAATTQAEFGVPTGTDAFTLCIYAGSAGASVWRADVPPDANAWRAISDKGWKYKDRAATADGVQAIVLKAGADGKAKAIVKGRGPALPDPAPGTLPVAADGFPVTVQLFNGSSNQCWTSVFEAADVKANGETLFKATTLSP